MRRPYSVLLPVGFAVPPPLPGARCALAAPFHRGVVETVAVCSLWHFPWGRPRRALPGTAVSWSPDFPRAKSPPPAVARPSGEPRPSAFAHAAQPENAAISAWSTVAPASGPSTSITRLSAITQPSRTSALRSRRGGGGGAGGSGGGGQSALKFTNIASPPIEGGNTTSRLPRVAIELVETAYRGVATISRYGLSTSLDPYSRRTV